MFQNRVIVITGGAGGIGKCIAEEFQKNGAHVCVIDSAPGAHYVGDIADKSVLEDFARRVIGEYGRVDVLVNNAPPMMHLTASMPLQSRYTGSMGRFVKWVRQ